MHILIKAKRWLSSQTLQGTQGQQVHQMERTIRRLMAERNLILFKTDYLE